MDHLDMDNVNGYELSRKWFDFAFEHPEKIKPAHGIVYFFAIEHCNRLGWKKTFGLPSTMAMEAVGISSYKTYKGVIDDLVEWGFLKMVQKSKNQYSSNKISLGNGLAKNTKALDKALFKHTKKNVDLPRENLPEHEESASVKNTKAHTKAMPKHIPKHIPKQVQSIVSIYKQENKDITYKPKNNYSSDFEIAWEMYQRKGSKKLAYVEWKKLTDEEKEKAKNHIPNYIQSNEPKYLKDFERYLKHGTFESAIITKQHTNGTARNQQNIDTIISAINTFQNAPADDFDS